MDRESKWRHPHEEDWNSECSLSLHSSETGLMLPLVSSLTPKPKITGPDKLYKSKLAGSEGVGSSTEHILSRPEIAGQRLLAKQADVRGRAPHHPVVRHRKAGAKPLVIQEPTEAEASVEAVSYNSLIQVLAFPHQHPLPPSQG